MIEVEKCRGWQERDFGLLSGFPPGHEAVPLVLRWAGTWHRSLACSILAGAVWSVRSGWKLTYLTLSRFQGNNKPVLDPHTRRFSLKPSPPWEEVLQLRCVQVKQGLNYYR